VTIVTNYVTIVTNLSTDGSGDAKPEYINAGFDTHAAAQLAPEWHGARVAVLDRA
jgi:hypothetical protein